MSLMTRIAGPLSGSTRILGTAADAFGQARDGAQGQRATADAGDAKAVRTAPPPAPRGAELVEDVRALAWTGRSGAGGLVPGRDVWPEVERAVRWSLIRAALGRGGQQGGKAERSDAPPGR